jgi:hypothetical protein
VICCRRRFTADNPPWGPPHFTFDPKALEGPLEGRISFRIPNCTV